MLSHWGLRTADGDRALCGGPAAQVVEGRRTRRVKMEDAQRAAVEQGRARVMALARRDMDEAYADMVAVHSAELRRLPDAARAVPNHTADCLWSVVRLLVGDGGATAATWDDVVCRIHDFNTDPTFSADTLARTRPYFVAEAYPELTEHSLQRESAALQTLYRWVDAAYSYVSMAAPSP